MRIRDILVPTDFSPASNTAWRYAQDLARRFKSRVHLLHVIAPPYLYDKWTGKTLPRTVPEFLREARQVAGAELARLVPHRGRLTGRVTTRVTTGPTVEDILRMIRTRHADIVVMGSHGRGPIGQVLLGRTAERVVARSPVPVVTVHARRRPRR